MTIPRAPFPRARRGARHLAASLAVVALVAVGAVSCSSSGSTGKPTSSTGPQPSESVQEFGRVEVSGDALPTFTQPGEADPAVGKKAPAVTGQRFDGSAITLAAAGKPTVIFFVAHWCPHCNREMPALVEEWAKNGQPRGVQLLSVSTGADQNAPNWPPSKWIADEKWPVPVLADSARQDAARAFGLPGYPFFVLLRPDGTVFSRHSGEWPVSSFNAEVAKLVAGSGAASSGTSS